MLESLSFGGFTVPFPFLFLFFNILRPFFAVGVLFAAKGSHVYDKATLNWCDPILACLLQDSMKRIETKREGAW